MDTEVALLTAECEMEPPLRSRNSENLHSASPVIPVSTFLLASTYWCGSSSSTAASGPSSIVFLLRHLVSVALLLQGQAPRSPAGPRSCGMAPDPPPQCPGPGPPHAAVPLSLHHRVATLRGGAPVPSVGGSRHTIRRREQRQALIARVRASLHGRRDNRDPP